MKKLIYSITVIIAAFIAIAYFWCPEICPKGCQYFYCAIDWLLTSVVLILVVLFLLCFWYPARPRKENKLAIPVSMIRNLICSNHPIRKRIGIAFPDLDTIPTWY